MFVMDSFYEQPRKAPNHRISPVNTGKLLPTAVPDVSMLLQNHGQVVQNLTQIPYNIWKMQQKNDVIKNSRNKENIIQQPSICRKQVRFESPQGPQINHTNKDIYVRPNVLCSGPILRQKPPPVDVMAHTTQFNNNILQSKPFEKIYMSNIPNRNLDLSIIEPPRMLATKSQKRGHNPTSNYPICAEKTMPLQCHNIYTLENSVAENDNQMLIQRRQPHAAESTTIEQRQKCNDEPSVKDLVKIIKQQNDQLMNLQKQVTTLLQERNQQYPQIQPKYPETELPDPLTVYKNKPIEPRNGLPKFAFDVMTSFEVSIRPPNHFTNRKFNRDFGNKPKLEEITDDKEALGISDIKTNKAHNQTPDVSLSLNEPFVLQEENLSPENSIHVDMQDFSSESEDDSAHSSLIGWTIYNNVMDQVNFLLKKSHQDDSYAKPTKVASKFTGTTIQQVKEATLKHLRNLGVNLPNTDVTDISELDSQCSQTEISYAVKQLLMKYLPDEQLAKISSPKSKLPNPTSYPNNLIKRRPEFSMATVQYMEKYNLLTKDNALVEKPQYTERDEGKLLDITALKQQPKLL